MVRVYAVALLVLAMSGCSWKEGAVEKQEGVYSSLDAAVIDFSGKVKGYLGQHSMKAPSDFTDNYIEIIEQAYPSGSGKHKVKTILSTYQLRARGLGDTFSVMLCEKDGRKLLEDFNCNRLRVEIKTWKHELDAPCEFEENWQDYCGP